MAAVIQIHEMSALASGADKTDGTVRFKDADNATVDANNPLVIPSEGSIYSYTKKLRAYMNTAPDTKVENLRWYSDGVNGWGSYVDVNVLNIGTSWVANSKTPISGGASMFGYTSDSPAPLDGDVTDVGPFLPAKEGSYIGDLIEMQMVVQAGASPGTLASETWTLAYDEV